MISHDHRCIFVHIPRTAGSSIEEWLCGADWWDIDPATKHLTARTARTIYADYWDDYFTFSFVRNPWDRMLSILHFDFYGVTRTNGEFDFSGYEERFGSPITLEVDYRFHDRRSLLREVHQPGAVYGNLLDEPLDFIGRFEDLATDAAQVAETLGIESRLSSHLKPSRSRPSTVDAYDDISNQWVLRHFESDIERFGYDPPDR